MFGDDINNRYFTDLMLGRGWQRVENPPVLRGSQIYFATSNRLLRWNGGGHYDIVAIHANQALHFIWPHPRQSSKRESHVWYSAQKQRIYLHHGPLTIASDEITHATSFNLVDFLEHIDVHYPMPEAKRPELDSESYANASIWRLGLTFKGRAGLQP